MAKKSRKKLLIITLSLLALGLTSAAGYTYFRNNQKQDDTGPTPQQEEAAKNSSASTQDTDTGEDKEATIDQSQQENQGHAQPVTPDFTLTIARDDQIGQNVEIRAFVNGVSQGICSVTFSGPGNTFTKSSSITFDGRTYSCGSLDAAASEFSQSGTWSYSLKATSAGKVSNTVQDKVVVQK